jgi:hypothetical protein
MTFWTKYMISSSVRPQSSDLQFESERFQKTEELAQSAFALQELRYLAWTALKAYDRVVLRKAQHAALDGPMEAMRAVLPLETPTNQTNI